MKESKVYQLALAAMFCAVGIVMPKLLHFIGPQAGRMFLPLFFGVSISALILPLKYTVMIAIFSPLISHLTSGMPPVPLLYFMVVECIVFGIVATKVKLSPMFKILVGLLVSRVVYIALVYVVVNGLHLVAMPATLPILIGTFTTSIPGIVYHMIVAPVIVRVYESTR